MKQFISALRMLIVMTVLTGVLYPVVVTLAANALFADNATGSFRTDASGTVVGSTWIGQKFTSPRYFQSRPSATDYAGFPSASSGTNLGPISATLKTAVDDRAAAFRTDNNLPSDAVVPPEMLFASGSGLDPQISPEAARLQIDRVASARGLSRDQVAAAVEEQVLRSQLGIFGNPRVNVFQLNLSLDNQFGK